MRRALIVLAAWAAVGIVPATANAQNWYDAIFPETSHNFGTVARGSKVRHAFKLVNTTSYDVHILDWRTKCGCTDVKVGARDIPPGTQTTIEATIDTSRFQGYKPSGLTLRLDRPSFAEVDLVLTCFIRGDVTLDPGQVEFGVVPRGGKPTTNLVLNYLGGQPGWEITKVNTISPSISARVGEPRRNGGLVQYPITATLSPDAPPGFLRDEIILTTNDPNSPTIPISVSARVQAAVTVAPSILNLGHIKAGQSYEKTVLVRSSKPFKVTGVSTSRSGDVKTTGTFEDAKTFHTLKVRLTAPTHTGPYHAIIEIETDLKDEPPAKLTAFATVVP